MAIKTDSARLKQEKTRRNILHANNELKYPVLKLL